MTFENEKHLREVWSLKSRSVSDYVRWNVFKREGKALTGDALATAKGALSAYARFTGERHELSVRVASHADSLYYDLGDWRAVKATRNGWTVEQTPPILFRHYPHQTPQVEPKQGSSLDRFLDLVNLRDETSKVLLKVYLVATLLDSIPLPVLVVMGEQGSAKSFLFRMLKSLVDPSILESLSTPDSQRDFVQLASHHRAVYLDNVTRLPQWLSDAMCRYCTGDGFSKRELYSDDDDVIYVLQGLGGVNGINLAASKADLLDRSMILKLDPISDVNRKSEQEVWAQFEAMKAGILGAMFDALSGAMRLIDSVQLESMPRLADFGRWGYAISESLGISGDSFIEAYRANVATQNEAALEESLVAQAVIEATSEIGQWTGTATELLRVLEARTDKIGLDPKAKSWPKSPSVLGRRLRECAPNLRRLGYEVQDRVLDGRTVWRIGPRDEGYAPLAPLASLNTNGTVRSGDIHDSGVKWDKWGISDTEGGDP